MHHYTYRIDFENGCYYFGKRSSIKTPEKDRYFGSGRICTSMREAGKKFIKTILKTFSTAEDAVNAEKELIGDLWDVESFAKGKGLCLNLIPGGRSAHKYVKTKEETKRLQSELKLGLLVGEKNGMYGKPSGMRGVIQEEHHNFGKKQYVNSDGEIKLFPANQVPEGYTPWAVMKGKRVYKSADGKRGSFYPGEEPVGYSLWLSPMCSKGEKSPNFGKRMFSTLSGNRKMFIEGEEPEGYFAYHPRFGFKDKSLLN